MTTNNDRPDAFRPEQMDLSQLTMEQLRELKDAIVARATDRVGPEGFNPVMMATTSGDLFNSFDWFTDPEDWLINVARVIYVLINVATRRIGLAIASSGAAVAASHMYATEAGARYAGIALGVAALLGAWMIVDMARSASAIQKG